MQPEAEAVAAKDEKTRATMGTVNTDTTSAAQRTSAQTIQAAIRGQNARDDLEVQNGAAITIQALHRGSSLRASRRQPVTIAKRTFLDWLYEHCDRMNCWAAAIGLTVDLCLDLFTAVIFYRRGDTRFFAVQMSIILIGAFFQGLSALVSHHNCCSFLLGFFQVAVLIEGWKSAVKNRGIATTALANIRLTRALTEAQASLLIRLLNILIFESDSSVREAFENFSIERAISSDSASSDSTALLCVSVVMSILLLTSALIAHEHWYHQIR
jgi:hypothetical protein